LIHAAAAFGIGLEPGAAKGLVRLAEMVAAANSRVHLTSITAWEDVLAKHLLDCLAPLALGCPLTPGQRVADLGSGGGFPGLVLALVLPGVSFTLIEATRKKAEFLVNAAAALALPNVAVWPRRAEEAGAAEGREAFDVVMARAVAELPVLVELAHPLLRVGGELLAWKGPDVAGEASAADGALSRLGGWFRRSWCYELPAGKGRRQLVAVVKTGPTPEGFPRRPGMAAKRPL